MDISVKLSNFSELEAKFRKAPAKMTAELRTAINRTILKLEGDAKRRAPVNKQAGGGNLRQSIRSFMIGPAAGAVEVGAKYGIFVHEGTRPHTIQVRSRRVLANRTTNQIFGRVVNHPGTRANPFLRDAVAQNQHWIDNEFMEAVIRVLH